MKLNRLIGLAFMASPVLINVPFALLAKQFDYPEILRAPASEILERFHAGGASLVFTWYAFAVAMLPALAGIAALPFVEGCGSRPRLFVATMFGVMATAFQLVGLIRWTFAVPVLAQLYTAPGASPETRAAAGVAFLALHQYAGVALGEHLGQLFTAVWMALLGTSMLTAPLFPRWLGFLGQAGALLWLVGLVEGFATVLPFSPGPLSAVAPVAFLVMGVWMIASGFTMWRQRIPSPSSST
jgi:hypothetical protein